MQYKEAMTQLQTIVRRVESSEVDVDELATAVRDANKLIAVCRQKLRSAEDEVAKALDDLRDGSSVNEDEEEEEIESDGTLGLR